MCHLLSCVLLQSIGATLNKNDCFCNSSVEMRCLFFSSTPHLSVACRNLVANNMGVRFRIPLQKLHPLSRAIHHRYSGNGNHQLPPHRTAARYFTSMSRLPMRPPKPHPGSGGHGYQQQRNFWVARLAARLLKLRYILLGSAVGGGYTAKKVSVECCALLVM